MGGSQLRGTVGGTAVGDDDFVRNGKSSEVLQEPGKARRLVEGRNDDRKERNQLRTRAWKRARMSRVIGPALPEPITRPSTCRIATTSLAVPVKKASSAV